MTNGKTKSRHSSAYQTSLPTERAGEKCLDRRIEMFAVELWRIQACNKIFAKPSLANQRAPGHPVPHLRIAQRDFNRTTRQSRMYAYESDFKTPYIQNFTLSANRDLTRKLNLDVRYVGTRGVSLLGTININSPDIFYNPALFDAFERTRRGENVELFDQILMYPEYRTRMRTLPVAVFTPPDDLPPGAAPAPPTGR